MHILNAELIFKYLSLQWLKKIALKSKNGFKTWKIFDVLKISENIIQFLKIVIQYRKIAFKLKKNIIQFLQINAV